MSLLLLLNSAPPANTGVVARGVVRAVRSKPDPRIARRTQPQVVSSAAPAPFSQTVAVPTSRITLAAVEPTVTSTTVGITSRGIIRPIRRSWEDRRLKRRSGPQALATTLFSITQTVAVPVAVVRDIAVPPTRTPGTATVAAPATTIRLLAVTPARTTTATVAVPSSRITLTAVAPARTTTVTRTVPAVSVRNIAVAPTVMPGTRTLTPQIGVLRLLAVAPQVQNFILVPAATLRLLAVAPSVTGGGGGGTVTLRKSGD
jgi:hypothetical protein